jgi:hypothetical protein
MLFVTTVARFHRRVRGRPDAAMAADVECSSYPAYKPSWRLDTFLLFALMIGVASRNSSHQFPTRQSSWPCFDRQVFREQYNVLSLPTVPRTEAFETMGHYKNSVSSTLEVGTPCNTDTANPLWNEDLLSSRASWGSGRRDVWSEPLVVVVVVWYTKYIVELKLPGFCLAGDEARKRVKISRWASVIFIVIWPLRLGLAHSLWVWSVILLACCSGYAGCIFRRSQRCPDKDCPSEEGREHI